MLPNGTMPRGQPEREKWVRGYFKEKLPCVGAKPKTILDVIRPRKPNQTKPKNRRFSMGTEQTRCHTGISIPRTKYSGTIIDAEPVVEATYIVKASFLQVQFRS